MSIMFVGSELDASRGITAFTTHRIMTDSQSWIRLFATTAGNISMLSTPGPSVAAQLRYPKTVYCTPNTTQSRQKPDEHNQTYTDLNPGLSSL